MCWTGNGIASSTLKKETNALDAVILECQHGQDITIA